VCRHIGTVELNLYRVFGMSAFYAIGYLRHPSRIVRTLRNVLAERSETVLEQRLAEFRRRRRPVGRAVPSPPPAADRGGATLPIASTAPRASGALSLASPLPRFDVGTHPSRRIA
jgi:hypothetical protein